MQITIRNDYSYFTNFTIGQQVDLYELLSVPVEGAEFTEPYKTGQWDGLRHYFHRGHNKIPTGLLYLPTVQEYVKELDVEYIDERVDPQKDIPYVYELLGDNEARDYQIRAIKAALDKKRGIIKVGIRGGKTFIMAGIIENLYKLNVVILGNNRQLMQQHADNLNNFMDDHVGLIMGGLDTSEVPKYGNRSINIISIPKINNDWKKNKHKGKLVKMVEEADVLILDECHHLKARTWFNSSIRSQAYYRFGLSDTPGGNTKRDEYDVMAITGNVIVSHDVKNLIDQGYVAKPYIMMIDINNCPSRLTRNFHYTEHVRRGIVQNHYRNDAILDFVELITKPTMIIVDRVAHGKKLSERLDAPFIYGKTPLEDRLKTIKDFDDGKIKTVIANTKVAGEGLDIKNIKFLIYAAGGKSYTKVAQATGRALTFKKDDNKAVIIDFLDNFSYHLKNNSEDRVEIYKRRGYDNITIVSVNEMKSILKGE